MFFTLCLNVSFEFDCWMAPSGGQSALLALQQRNWRFGWTLLTFWMKLSPVIQLSFFFVVLLGFLNKFITKIVITLVLRKHFLLLMVSSTSVSLCCFIFLGLYFSLSLFVCPRLHLFTQTDLPNPTVSCSDCAINWGLYFYIVSFDCLFVLMNWNRIVWTGYINALYLQC